MTDYVRVKCPDCGESIEVAIRVESVHPRRGQHGHVQEVEVVAKGVQHHFCAGKTGEVDGL